MDLHIVLHEPEIPQNTGNIARTCAVLGAKLHLIEPLGFSLEQRYLRRAGLDYWGDVTVATHRDLPGFFETWPQAIPVPVSTKAPRPYTDVAYVDPCFLFFGKESAGLPEAFIRTNHERAVRIPMLPGTRSLNLSNAVAVVAYEVLRQRGFSALQARGHLGEAL